MVKTTKSSLLSHLAEHPRDWDALLALADAVTDEGGDGRGYEALARRRQWPCHVDVGGEWIWFRTAAYGPSMETDLTFDWFERLADPGWIVASYPTAVDALAAAADAFLRLPPHRQRQLLARKRRSSK